MKSFVNAAVLLLCIMFAVGTAGRLQARTLTETNAPLGNASFSNLSWCLLNNQGDTTLGERDTLQVNGLLTNNTGYKQGFRIGVRLVSAYGTAQQKDHTFGGPTYLYGTSISKDEKTGANIQDLNLMGAAGGNVDIRESFGEVQNIAPLANGGIGSFSAVLGIGNLPEGTSVRVELYAFDQRSNTLQASLVGGAIPYSAGGGGSCLNLTGTSGNIGAGITLTDTDRIGNVKFTGGWINVSKPAYEPTDPAMLIEFTVLNTSTPHYEHDFDRGAAAFILELWDKSTNSLAATITGASSTKQGCLYTTTVSRSGGGGGAATLTCRLINYYANLGTGAGRSPETNGYVYSWAAFAAGSGWPMTHVLSIPTGSSNPWLIPGRVYDVKLKAGSGSGSHYMAADSSDSFLYSATPTAVTLISFSGSGQGEQPAAPLGLAIAAGLGLWATTRRLRRNRSS